MASYIGKSKLIAIGAGLCLAAGAAISLANSGNDSHVRIAIINTSVQVIGVVVIGGAANVIARAYHRQKQKFDHLRDFRWRIRAQLVQAYSAIEQSRSILLARGGRGMQPGFILAKIYDEQMEKMCAARLDIRAVRLQVEVGSSKAYVYERDEDSQETEKVKARLVAALERMETHVQALNSEWEKTLPSLNANATYLPAPQLLKDMLSPDSTRLNEFEAEYEFALFILRSPSIHEFDSRNEGAGKTLAKTASAAG